MLASSESTVDAWDVLAAEEDELELELALLLEESEELDELELSELEESSCLLLASLSRSLTLDRTLA